MYSSKKFEELYSSEENVLIQEIVNKICSATAGVPASSRLQRESVEGLQRSLINLSERRRKGETGSLKEAEDF